MKIDPTNLRSNSLNWSLRIWFMTLLTGLKEKKKKKDNPYVRVGRRQR